MPNGTVATYTLKFNADTNQAKQELQSLQKAITDVVTQRNSANPLKGFTEEANNAASKIAELNSELQKSTNTNGSLNIAKLANLWKENGKSLDYYKQHFASLGPEGERAFRQLAASIANAQKPMRELDGLLGKFTKGLLNTTMWTIQSQAIHGFQRALSGAFSYAQQLNKGLTDIAIVADMSSDKLAQFAKDANKYAQQWSTTTNEYVKGALIYYQQGLSGEEVIEKTNTTVKLANTSGESAEQISSYMTAIWNNFDDGSKTIEYYADVISYLGAATAASNADIAEGMQAFAATAETVGLSYEYAASALTTLRHVTQQSASTIGNSLKTIFARLSSVKSGGTTEDGVDYTKYTKELAKYGVNVVDVNGDLKDMDQILDDLAKKWVNLSNAQKVALAQTVGGVRQYNNLISLMDNYEYFQELVQGSYESEGYLNKQSEIYEKSWQAATNHVKTAVERLYNILIDDKVIIGLTNAFAKIVNFVGAIVEKAGGLRTLLPLIVSSISTGIHDKLESTVDKMKELVNQTTHWKDMLKDANLLRAQGIKETINSIIPDQVNEKSKASFDSLKDKLTNGVLELTKKIEEGKTPQEVIDKMTLMLEKEARALADFANQQNEVNAKIEDLNKLDSRFAPFIEAQGKVTGLYSIVNSDNFTNMSYNEIGRLLGDAYLSKGAEKAFGDKFTGYNEALSEANLKDKTKTFNGVKIKNRAHLQELLQDFLEKYFTGLEEELDKLTEEAAKKKTPKDQKKTGKSGGKKADTAGDSKKNADAFKEEANAGKEVKDTVDGINKSKEDLKNKNDELHNSISQTIEDMQREAAARAAARASLASQINSIVGVGSALISMTSAADNALDGVWEMITAFNDGDKAGERFAGGLKKVGASLGALMTSFAQYTRSLSMLATINPELVGSIALMKTSITEAGKGLLNAIKGVVGFGTASTTSTGGVITLSGAVGHLAESIGGLLADMLPLVAGIMAAILAFKAFKWVIQKIIELTPEGKLKKLQEETEKAAQTANESAEAYDNLVTALSSIDDKEEALSKMTRGTQEWKEAIEELNKEMLLLIAEENLVFGNKGDAGADWWYNEDGKIEFAPGVRERITKNRANKAKEDKNAELITKTAYNKQAYDNTKKSKTNDRNEIEALVSLLGDEGVTAAFEHINWNRKETIDSFFAAVNNLNTLKKIDFEEKNGRETYIPDDTLQGLLTYTTDDLYNDKYIDYENSLIQLLKNNIDEDISNGALKVIADKIIDGTFVFDPNKVDEFWKKNKDELEQIIEKEKVNAEPVDLDKTYRVPGAQRDLENEGNNFSKKDKRAIADLEDELTAGDYSGIIKDEAKTTEGSMTKIATAAYQARKGIDEWTKSWYDWADAIKHADKTSNEYIDAMIDIKDALADLLGMTDELSEIDMTFGQDFADKVAKNMDIVYAALSGNKDAALEVSKWATKDVAKQLTDEWIEAGKINETQADQLGQQLDEYLNYFQYLLDNDKLELGPINDTAFLQSLENMINALGLTQEDAERAMKGLASAMGVDIEYDWDDAQTERVGLNWIPSEGYGTDSVNVGVNEADTFTWVTRPTKLGDWEEVPATESTPLGAIRVKTADYVGGGNITTKKTGSTRIGGNRSPKHSGGGGHERKKKAKDEDRYHEINQKLKQTEHELDKINTLKDRSYGRGRLNAMDEEIKLLEREAEQYKEMYKEAEHWFSLDKSALVKYGATFNDDGTIANYQAWQARWIDAYNNESISEEEFDAWQKAVSKYEDSLAHLNDAEKKYIETMNKIYDEHLEKVVYRVKYLNELIKLSTDYLDYLIEKLDEDMYDTAEVVADLGKKASGILEQIGNIQQGIIDALTDDNNHPKMTKELIEGYLAGEKDLEEVLKNISQLTDKEQEQLRDWMQQLLDYNKELRKTQKEAYDKIIESVEEFNDKIKRQGDIVKDVSGIMQHYANVIDIIGKDTLGISDAMMNALSDLQVTGAQANLTIATNQLNENKRILAEIQKNLEEARARGTEADIKYFEEALEQQEDIVRGLAEEWASAYEDALKAAQDAFTNGVKLATEAFDKAVSGSIGSLDKLQDFYDKQTTLQDLFLPDYERIHDLSKLVRDVNTAINNTDNIKGKERLRNLQEDILRAQQEGTKLSKYDVEFMEKRLELEKAQIALEEARNAKNMVRMTRDSEGNWSYTYTQNPEDLAKAEQAVEDAMYNAEKLQQERVKEVLQDMLSNMAKFRDEIANSDMSDEEKKNALIDYWQEMINTNGDLLQTALNDGEWLTNTYDILSHNLVDSFEETLLALGTGYETLDDFMNNFNDATGVMSEETAAQYQKWGDYIRVITEAAGINFDNFAQKVADDMDLVIQAMIGADGTGGAVGVAKQLADELGISIDDILEELRTWWDGPEGRSFQMEAEIAQNEMIYEQLEKLIASADEIPIELPKISTAVQKIASGGNECGCGATCTTTCWTDCGSNGASQPKCGCGGNCSHSCEKTCGEHCSVSCFGTCRGTTKTIEDTGPERPEYGGGFATGGYTGSWGTFGKLAILHEKELVLNAEDTENMLQTVGFVRDLVEMLTTNAGISASGLGNLIAGSVSNANSYLDQNVTIHAEFPNATNHSEIEEAFENLIGLASQYAGRKQ